ncbi:MAG: CPBP family intramembrane metalloprotease [Bacteroidales bacterium]|nr:CPBP family intramembrane metalloprotease [Bacteroidales bacterium]
MKKAINFSIIVCLASWIFAAFMWFGMGIHNTTDNLKLYSLCAAIYMFFPLVCALVIQIIKKEKLGSTGLLKFKIKWSWLVAWLLPVVIVAATIIVNSLLDGCELKFHMPPIPGMENLSPEEMAKISAMQNPKVIIITTLVSGLFAGITINAIAAFGEEYGWRNYLVSLLKGRNFWVACLFIGVVWGFWHFPIILMGHNYFVHRTAGVFMMVAMCLVMTPIELYLVLKAKSVYPAAIFHGTVNAMAGATMLFISGGSDLINGVAGLSGIITMAVVTLILFVYDRFVSEDKIMSKKIEL